MEQLVHWGAPGLGVYVLLGQVVHASDEEEPVYGL